MPRKDWMIKETQLDDDQLAVLNAILDKSCIVTGCAGSGKSVLALIKAQRIQAEKGNNYQIIVYTKALCAYMNAGRRELGLNQMFTYHWDWVNKKKCPSSDYIIVDEIQDFTSEEILQFVAATNKHFFFFGDTAQSIYEGHKDTVRVEDIVRVIDYNRARNVKLFPLYRNYRLPIAVAKVAQYVGVDLEPFEIQTYKSKEPELPRFIQRSSLNEQIDTIVKIIGNRDLKDVAILAKNNDMVMMIHKLLDEKKVKHVMRYNDKNDYHNSVDTLRFDTDLPKLLTYHSAKGLQFEAVFVPNVADTYGSGDRKALYVAMTRTYRLLYVLYSSSLPYPLSEITDNSLYQENDIDVTDDK